MPGQPPHPPAPRSGDAPAMAIIYSATARCAFGLLCSSPFRPKPLPDDRVKDRTEHSCNFRSPAMVGAVQPRPPCLSNPRAGTGRPLRALATACDQSWASRPCGRSWQSPAQAVTVSNFSEAAAMNVAGAEHHLSTPHTSTSFSFCIVLQRSPSHAAGARQRLPMTLRAENFRDLPPCMIKCSKYRRRTP